MKTVVFIDSDLGFADENVPVFEALGLKVHQASTLEKGRILIGRIQPRIIVSEVDLPDGDGISLFLELRKQKEFNKVALILISEKKDSYIQVMAYEAGVDDYFIKPLNKRLFAARLKSLQRRLDGPNAVSKNPDLYINRDKFIIEYKGREITLPRKEFEILSLLFNHKGIVFNRDKIKEVVWATKANGVNSRTVDVHIKNIRELIGPRFIKTVKGVGYKFVG